MPESPITLGIRSATRRTGAPEVRPVSVSIPVGPVESATSVVVTITADNNLSVKGVKNALERAVRIAAKAAPALDMAGFLALVEAITEVSRLEKAGRDAKVRIRSLLTGTRADTANENANGQAPNSSAPNNSDK